jgi:hypothetical protein
MEQYGCFAQAGVIFFDSLGLEWGGSRVPKCVMCIRRHSGVTFL